MIHVSELFEINNGSNLDLNKVEKTNDKDGIPFVSRTKKNNGVLSFVKEDVSHKINKSGTISVALVGNVMTSYYHNYDYYSSQGMVILKPKTKLTEYELIFYCLCLQKNFVKYNYGRIPDKQLSEILLPKKIPDYVNTKNIPLIKHTYKRYKTIDLEPVLISDYFDLFIGKKIVSLNELIKGDTPVVSATEFNNGVSLYANITPEFNFKALTISKNGSVGEVFYQEDPFCATKDVIVMKPKFQFTNSIGIFISVILKLYFKTKFSYGRKITINKLNNAIIPLPLNVDKKTIDVTAIQLFMDDMKTDYYSNFEKSANLSEFLII